MAEVTRRNFLELTVWATFLAACGGLPRGEISGVGAAAAEGGLRPEWLNPEMGPYAVNAPLIDPVTGMPMLGKDGLRLTLGGYLEANGGMISPSARPTRVIFDQVAARAGNFVGVPKKVEGLMLRDVLPDGRPVLVPAEVLPEKTLRGLLSGFDPDVGVVEITGEQMIPALFERLPLLRASDVLRPEAKITVAGVPVRPDWSVRYFTLRGPGNTTYIEFRNGSDELMGYRVHNLGQFKPDVTRDLHGVARHTFEAQLQPDGLWVTMGRDLVSEALERARIGDAFTIGEQTVTPLAYVKTGGMKVAVMDTPLGPMAAVNAWGFENIYPVDGAPIAMTGMVRYEGLAGRVGPIYARALAKGKLVEMGLRMRGGWTDVVNGPEGPMEPAMLEYAMKELLEGVSASGGVREVSPAKLPVPKAIIQTNGARFAEGTLMNLNLLAMSGLTRAVGVWMQYPETNPFQAWADSMGAVFGSPGGPAYGEIDVRGLSRFGDARAGILRWQDLPIAVTTTQEAGFRLASVDERQLEELVVFGLPVGWMVAVGGGSQHEILSEGQVVDFKPEQFDEIGLCESEIGIPLVNLGNEGPPPEIGEWGKLMTECVVKNEPLPHDAVKVLWESLGKRENVRSLTLATQFAWKENGVWRSKIYVWTLPETTVLT